METNNDLGDRIIDWLGWTAGIAALILIMTGPTKSDNGRQNIRITKAEHAITALQHPASTTTTTRPQVQSAGNLLGAVADSDRALRATCSHGYTISATIDQTGQTHVVGRCR